MHRLYHVSNLPCSPCSKRKNLLTLIAHLLTTIAKLLGPGDARAIVTDSLLVIQQLLINNSHRERAPKQNPLDQFLLGFWSLFLFQRQIKLSAVIIRPPTLFAFHQWLNQRKYRRLCASGRKTKPSIEDPSEDIIDAVVQLQQCDPRFGCPRIAQQISHASGTSIDKDIVRQIKVLNLKSIRGNHSVEAFFRHRWLRSLGIRHAQVERRHIFQSFRAITY